MKSINSCYIVGAGDFASKYFKPSNDDLIICADGGFDSIDKQKYKISYLIGDNDSIKNPHTVNIPSILYKSEKDETDMDLALRKAIELGYTRIKLFGGYGNRPDHFIANIQLMHRYAKNKIDISIFAKSFVAYCINNAKISFKKTSVGKTISVFSLSDKSTDVTISGLKYNISKFNLYNDFSLGVSNKTIGESVDISVKDGTLFIMSYDYLANKNSIVSYFE